MSDHHSNTPNPSDKPATAKPSKLYPDYPLTPHPSGQWCKKIRGRIYYFGKIDDPDAALARYNRQREDLHAGKKPRANAVGTTIKQLCYAFLDSKQALVESGELLARTLNDYKFACGLLISRFGKSRRVDDLGPDDFQALRSYMAKEWAITSVRTVIQWIRCIFKFASDNRLISAPVCYGQGFKRPAPKVMRLERARRGKKLFTASEIRRLIDAASVPVRAQILLGVNAGFGNTDCGTLPQAAIDWSNAIIDYPRPKTGIERRCSLWPETIAALKEALASRPAPKSQEHDGLVFLTQRGLPWAKDIADSPLTKEVAKLLHKLGINGRKGLGFYTLRHVFRTVADETKDQPAIFYIMGHEIPDMSSIYRESISDARLRAVADHVRKWLFPTAGQIECVD